MTPDVRTTLRSLPAGRPVVLVPLLLSSGYHDRVDLPAAVASARADAVRAPVLGPDPLLSVALESRLADAGLSGADAVVLAAAGSSDPDAVASVHAQAADLARRLGRPVTVGFGSAATPTVAEAVAVARAGLPATYPPSGATGTVAARDADPLHGTVAIAPYLLAPGYFADQLRSAGADGVAEPLGAHAAVVDLVLERFSSTLG